KREGLRLHPGPAGGGVMKRLMLAAIVPLIASFGIALTPTTPVSAVTPTCAGTSLRTGATTGDLMRVPTVGNATPNQFDCILGPGDSSTAVSRLQIDLNFCNAAGLKVDGIYGINTTNAVKAMQRLERVTVDGVYGPMTIDGGPGGAFPYET